jgi:hypothetical protein
MNTDNDYTELEAIAAVIFRIKKVESALLCESEKIIMELATIIDEMIAEMKYTSVFRSGFLLTDQIIFRQSF